MLCYIITLNRDPMIIAMRLTVKVTLFSAIFGLIHWSLLTIIKGYEKNRKLPFGTFLSITSIFVYSIQINWDLFRNF